MWFHEYTWAQSDENKAKKKKDDLRTNLYEYILENGEPDENGNIVWMLDKPMLGPDGEIYRGMMLQRRTSEFLDEEKAREIIEKHHIEVDCIKIEFVETVDFDELYAFNQKGVVPDEDIDSIIDVQESFALTKIKQ